MRYVLLLLGWLVVSAVTLTAAPQQEPLLQVRGRLIDIRTAKAGQDAFPQYKRHRFGKSLPAAYVGMRYAVSLKEFAGAEAVRADQPCQLRIAICGQVPDAAVWQPTGEHLYINKNRFVIYKAQYTTPNQWMSLPTAGEGGLSPLM